MPYSYDRGAVVRSNFGGFDMPMRFVGVCMGVASLYASRLVARIVPADLRSVLGSSFGCVCMSL